MGIKLSGPRGNIIKDGLTAKQLKFVKKVVETGSLTDAAEAVYNVKNRRNAHTLGRELKKNPRVKEALLKAFEKSGLTADFIADSIKENIVTGVGIKSSADSANRAIDIWAKLTGAYNDQNIEQSYKVTLHKLPTQEMITELEKRTKISSGLLDEIKDY